MNALTKMKPATAHEIREMLGPGEEDMIVAILDTGACSADIIQALEWLNGDAMPHSELRKLAGPRAGQVFDILDQDRERFAPDER